MEVNIRSSVLKIAELMLSHPGGIEFSFIRQGAEFLALFEDLTFSENLPNFVELKKELFLMVAEDLAMGGVALKTSSIGLKYTNNEIKTFISPFGSTDSGNVVFSITIRQVAAFKNWRKVEVIEFSSDQLNSAIYYLAHELSKIEARIRRDSRAI